MNEQAILDSYNLFKQSGYTKSLDEYKKLLNSNPSALNDSYSLFKQSGYNKGVDDYKELMGLKKKVSTQPLPQNSSNGETIQKPKAPQNTSASYLGGTSSDSSYTNDIPDAIKPNKTNFLGTADSKPVAKQLPKFTTMDAIPAQQAQPNTQQSGGIDINSIPTTQKTPQADATSVAMPNADIKSELPINDPTKDNKGVNDPYAYALKASLETNPLGGVMSDVGVPILNKLGTATDWLLKSYANVLKSSENVKKQAPEIQEQVSNGDDAKSIFDRALHTLNSVVSNANDATMSPIATATAVHSKIINSALPLSEKNALIDKINVASTNLEGGLNHLSQFQKLNNTNSNTEHIIQSLSGMLPEIGAAALTDGASLEAGEGGVAENSIISKNGMSLLEKYVPKAVPLLEKYAPKVASFVKTGATNGFAKVLGTEGALESMANTKDDENVYVNGLKGYMKGSLEALYMHGLGELGGELSKPVAKKLVEAGTSSAIANQIANPLANAGVFASAKILRTGITEGRVATPDELAQEVGIAGAFSLPHIGMIGKNHNEIDFYADNLLKDDALPAFSRVVNETKDNLVKVYNPNLSEKDIDDLKESRDAIKTEILKQSDLSVKQELLTQAINIQNTIDANTQIPEIIKNKDAIKGMINDGTMDKDDKDFYTKKIEALSTHFDTSEEAVRAKELAAKIKEKQEEYDKAIASANGVLTPETEKTREELKQAQQNDKENGTGVQSNIGEGKEPIKAKPNETTGGEKVETGGNVQASEEEVVKPIAEQKAETGSAGVVEDAEYNDFIDKGKVSEARLNDIANKIKNREPLSDREKEIFSDKTGEINKIIATKAGSGGVGVEAVNSNSDYNRIDAELYNKWRDLNGEVSKMDKASDKYKTAKKELDAADKALTDFRNNNTDLILEHGTPHDFDKFQLEKIGTGEGHQAFGHGLYFTENSKIAKSYAEKLSKDKDGIVYQVKIKDGRLNDWLEWRDALSDSQAEKLSSIVKSKKAEYEKYLETADEKSHTGASEQLFNEDAIEDERPLQAGAVYEDLRDAFGSQEATRIMQEAGIDGVKYKTKGGKGEDFNYVVFNPESIVIENKQSIKETPEAEITKAGSEQPTEQFKAGDKVNYNGAEHTIASVHETPEGKRGYSLKDESGEVVKGETDKIKYVNESSLSKVEPENIAHEEPKVEGVNEVVKPTEETTTNEKPKDEDNVYDNTISGIKNKKVDSFRAKNGLEPITQKFTQAYGDTFKDMLEHIDDNPNFLDDLVSAINNGEPTIKGKDGKLVPIRQVPVALNYNEALINTEKMQLNKELEIARKEGNDKDEVNTILKLGQNQEKRELNHLAARKSGNDTAAGLSLRRTLLDEDFSPIMVQQEMDTAFHGRENIPPEIQKTIDDSFAKIKELNIKLDEANEIIAKEKAQNAVDNEVKRQKRQKATPKAVKNVVSELRSTADRVRNSDILDKIFGDKNEGITKNGFSFDLKEAIAVSLEKIATSIESAGRMTNELLIAAKELASKFKEHTEDEYKAILGKLYVNTMSDESKVRLDENYTYIRDKIAENNGSDLLSDKMIPDIRSIVREYIANGLNDAEVIVKEIHDNLKGDIKGLSEEDIREAISGEGRFKEPTKNDLLHQFNSLKRIIALEQRLKKLKESKEPANPREKRAKEENIKKLEGLIDEEMKKNKLGKYSDEHRNETSQKSAQKIIDDLQQKLDNNELEIKASEKLNETQKTKELKEKSDNLRKELEQRRKDSKLGKYSDEAKNTVAQEAFKAKIAEIRERIKTGNFSTEKAKPFERNKRTQELQLELQKEKDKLEAIKDKQNVKNIPKGEKLVRWITDNMKGAMVAFSMPKLTAAALMKVANEIPLEASRRITRKFVRQSVRDKALVEGGASSTKLANQIQAKYHSSYLNRKIFEEVGNIFLHGKNDWTRINMPDADNYGYTPTFAKYIYRSHQAVKYIPKKAAYERAFALAMDKLSNTVGVDINSPLTLELASKTAKDYAMRDIFMGNNELIDRYKRATGEMKQIEGSINKLRYFVKGFVFPVVTVPVNYASERASYLPAVGWVAANRKTLFKSIDNISPEQADYLVRNLSRHNLGSFYFALGCFLYGLGKASSAIWDDTKKSGYGQKIGDKNLNPRDLKLGDTEIKHTYTHGMMAQSLMDGVMFAEMAKENGDKNGGGVINYLDASFSLFNNVANDVPFYTEPKKFYHWVTGKDKITNTTEYIANRIIPPQIGTMSDKDWEGNTVKRDIKGDTFAERTANIFKRNIPILRKTLPEKK